MYTISNHYILILSPLSFHNLHVVTAASL